MLRATLVGLVTLLAASASAQSTGPDRPLPGAQTAGSQTGEAQTGEAQTGEVQPGLSDSVRVSLLTMMPGREAYSLFGHSALRIRDAAAGLDRTYNFGTFSFDQPFFVARFLGGSLDYQLATDPFDLVLYAYQDQGRPIVEQTLDLDARTARALYDVLETNALPENRAYRYDFFWDNCSTRLLGAVDSALARTGEPPVTLPPVDAALTFRDLVRPYVRGAPAAHLGTDLALALPADAVATAREQTFLPLELAAQLDRATVGGRPLVASRDTLFWVPGAGLPAPAVPWPTLAGWAVLGVVVFGSVLAGRRARDARGLDAVLFGVVGVSGLLMLLLWVATSHTVTGPNVNLLWAWPTHVVAAWAVLRRRAEPRWQPYFALSAVVTGLTIAFWGVLPQELPLAVMPVAFALALRSGVRAWPLVAARRAAHRA